MSNIRRYLAVALATATLMAGGATATAAQPVQKANAESEARVLANADFPRGTQICKNMALTSGDGGTLLRVQEDGNLVVYVDGQPRWQAPGAWSRGNCLVFQEDGNFVLYDASGSPVWAADTWNRGETLSVQDDGNVVIYNAAGTPIWHTNTAR